MTLSTAALSEDNVSSPSPDNSHTWNLKNVDIQAVINEIAIETKRNFVLSPEVKGKVTFISGHPLTPEELYQAFLALLQSNGFIAVPEGAVIRIVPETSVKGQSTQLYSSAARSSPGEMAVAIVRVKYVAAAELVKILKNLVVNFGYIEAYPPTNDIIISDFGDNISRLLTLIHRLDRSSATHIGVIHLKYSQATDAVKMVTVLLKQKEDNFKNIAVTADQRNNNILIYGGTAEQQEQIHGLMIQLDTSINTTVPETKVISLKYLRAEKVAVIVNSLIDNDRRVAANSSSSHSSIKEAPDSLKQDTPYQLPDFVHTKTTSGEAIQANGINMGGGTQASVNFDNMQKKSAKSGSISPFVQWEESTNSLILTATPDLMHKLTQVIRKLDVHRPQVLIEAVIAEVEVNLANELGVEINSVGQAQLLTRFNSILPLSGTGNNNAISISNPPSENAVGQGLTGAFFRGGNLRLLIRALEQDTRSNILSTPNIVTLDNEPAQIKVGQRISFSIGQIQNNPTGGNPFNYFNQQDVGLILTINPQIAADGTIRLIIEQELSNVLPGQVSAGSNPDLSERFIHTTVMARDGDLLVLGGLIQDEWQDTVSKVPLLGDLPVIGALFSSHGKQLKRENLMIFLRPTILYGQDKTAATVNKRYQNIQFTQVKTTQKDSPSLTVIKPPVLPGMVTESADLPQPFEKDAG